MVGIAVFGVDGEKLFRNARISSDFIPSSRADKISWVHSISSSPKSIWFVIFKDNPS
ncbi:hypothetical protein D3C78_1943520 [compost metagenome]